MQEYNDLIIQNNMKLSLQENKGIENHQKNKFNIQMNKITNQIKVGDENQNIDQNQIVNNHDTKSKHLKDPKQKSSNSLQECNKSSTNNIEKQVVDDQDMICNNMSESNSSYHQKMIDVSSLQIEKMGSIQSAVSRQISEKYCQQFQMHSDFDDSSQVIANSQVVSTDCKIKKQKNEDTNSNYSSNSQNEILEEKVVQDKNCEDLKQKERNLNLGSYNYHRNDEDDISSVDDEDDYEEDDDEDNYSSDSEYYGNNNQINQGEPQEYLQNDQLNQYRDNPLLSEQHSKKEQQFNKDIMNINNEKLIQNQLPLYQNRQVLKNSNDEQIINKDDYTLHKDSIHDQISKQISDQQTECFRSIVANKNNESQYTSIKSNKNQNFDSSDISSSFLQESDLRQKKLDLVQRMKQLKGELNNDIEQAHNELLKLKTQKSLQLQDSCDSQNDNLERQNIDEDFSNQKQNYNKYFEISNSIQTPAFIIENNSESKQSNSNGGISTQTNASFAQLKQSELGGNYNEQNIVKNDVNDCLVQQQSQISSQANFEEGNGDNLASDMSLSQNLEQNNNQIQNMPQQKRNEQINNMNLIGIHNQKQQQHFIKNQNSNNSEIQGELPVQKKQIRLKTEEKTQNNNMTDHMDQLQLLEQEKFKIQQLILEKQRKFQMQSELAQSEMNNSKNTVHTLPPSKDVSYVSTNSIQTQQNNTTISIQKSNDKSFNSQQIGQIKNIQNQQQQIQQYQNQCQINQLCQTNIQQQFQQYPPQQQLFNSMQIAQDQIIMNQPHQELQQQKKKIASSSKNSQKKKSKQKQAKESFSPAVENKHQNKNDKSQQSSASKNLLTRNLSNPRIQTQSGNKAEGVILEGVEMKKQLEEKFQMQLEEIHYKNHLKIQKLIDKMKLLEEENAHMKYELKQRSLAAKELKESEARIADLAQSISDINIGKLIQQELDVKSLKEAYVKLKNTYKNHIQEKKFINCILDMVNSCNPQQINKNPNKQTQNATSQQNTSSNSDQASHEQEEQADLKKAWKWLRFIIEDYVNLKSKSMYYVNNIKQDKNSQMYKSCVVDTQNIAKPNQNDINQSPQLSLASDNLILQEINSLLNTENKYESLKGIKEILAQNELYRQQISYYQKKGESKKSSNSTSFASGSSKRVHTLGSASVAYNPSKDSVIQTPSSQPLYTQQQQQQQRLLSPNFSQKINNTSNNKQNTHFSSPQKLKSNGLSTSKPQPNNINLNQGVMMNNNNNNINNHADMNGGMQKQQQQLMRKLSPKNNSNQVIQSENDYNCMNFTSNNNQNYINGKQNQNNSNLKNSGNYTNHTSPSRQHMQGNMKQDRINTLNLSPRENNSNYTNNNTGQQINSPQSYKRTKTSQCYSTNPYLQVMEKQSSKQF